jgi:hypothetical protein
MNNKEQEKHNYFHLIKSSNVKTAANVSVVAFQGLFLKMCKDKDVLCD